MAVAEHLLAEGFVEMGVDITDIPGFILQGKRSGKSVSTRCRSFSQPRSGKKSFASGRGMVRKRRSGWELKINNRSGDNERWSNNRQ
jgi:hypothetical protein